MAMILIGCGSESSNDTEDSAEVNEEDSVSEEGVYSGSIYLKDIASSEIVTLGDYKNIEITLADVEITEADVDVEMDNLLISYPMPVDSEEPAAEGDEVNIDYVGTKDGVEFEGGTGSDTLVIGSGSYIADLEQGLIGMTVGEVKEVPVTFPDNYTNVELAGQPAVFTVTMNTIQTYQEITEITDEYVVWLTGSEFNNVADFREQYRTDMISQAESTYEMERQGLIAEAVVADCEFKELPQAFLQRLVDNRTSGYTQYAQMYGLDLETFMMYSQLLPEGQTAEEAIADQAENDAKIYLAYQAIADIENIIVEESEVDEGIAEMAEQAGTTAEEYAANIDKELYKESLMINKVTEFLEESTVINKQ